MDKDSESLIKQTPDEQPGAEHPLQPLLAMQMKKHLSELVCLHIRMLMDFLSIFHFITMSLNLYLYIFIDRENQY